MCGIAGTYLWPDGGPLTDRLTKTLAHRGPDGSGRYEHRAGAGEVHLGHRRLSIIDLSETGAQPMALDGLALIASLLYYWVPDSRCAYQGAEKLPPGTWLRCRPDGQVDRGRFWSLREVAEEGAAFDGEVDLHEVIAESTAKHLLSDVPVAT